jgi:hypothetical protein
MMQIMPSDAASCVFDRQAIGAPTSRSAWAPVSNNVGNFARAPQARALNS